MGKRITKLMAEKAAINIAKMYLKDELEEANKRLTNYATSIVYALVPKEVLDVTAKYKDNFIVVHTILFYAFDEGVKQKDLYATVKCDVPNGSDYLAVDMVTYKNLMEIKKEILNIDDKRSKFREELKSALFSLGTREKIEKTFPNALKYIDFGEVEKKSLPVSNYTNLQQIINKL